MEAPLSHYFSMSLLSPHCQAFHRVNVSLTVNIFCLTPEQYVVSFKHLTLMNQAVEMGIPQGLEAGIMSEVANNSRATLIPTF